MLSAVSIGLASATLLLLATAMGLVLGWANRAFHVEIDPRVARVHDALPGANCGGCGYVGCGEYAEAVVQEGAAVTLCAPGGPSVAQRLAEILGVAVEPTWPYRAVVHCGATREQRKGQTEYRGEPTCTAANLVADVQACVYGCLGLGDCVVSCDYDAIHIVDGVARVDYTNCTGCGACVDACPRGIISRIPFKAERVLVVACANQDFGADVRAVCAVGCVGCTACTKLSSLLAMDDHHLPVVDYEHYDPKTADFTKAIEKCPMESLLWVGKPTPEDVEATEDEELPERVDPTFDTTVDRAQWWG